MSHSPASSDQSKKQILPADLALRARDRELESLKAVVGRLAHDFNNALVPILGYVSMAKEDLEPGTGPANFVTAAENGARKTERHLDSILLAVFPHRKFSATPGNLADVAGEEIEKWKASLPAGSKIELSSHLEPCLLNLDTYQWQTLCQHLLRNATQALPRGGKIEFNLSRVILDENEAAQLGVKPGDFGLITCEDNGTGMTPEVLRRCMEPFFSTRPKTQSPGLGLTTVHSISRFHGGQTRVTSGEGRGTKVEVWVPLE